MGRSSVFSLEQIYRKQVTQTWSKIPEVFRYVNSIGGSSPAGTDYGYFMGGSAECCPYLAPFSTVDRLDFSNDTDNMVAKAALTTAKAYMRGFSSFTHGYTAGGYAPAVSARVTTIDRIDYASDTTAQTAKGPLEVAVSLNAVGLHNTEYGYTLGGSSSPSVQYTSYNQRLEFANDTTTTAPKGNLGQNKRFGAGAGNQSYGYYSGGQTPSRISSVERLDYSSDTSTLAPKGPLSRIVNEHDAAGNADYGYHAGGWDPSSPYSNVTDRIDYASDTATALVKAILAYPGKHGPTTTGNTSYGYWTGGYGNTTASHRLDYSSDTTQMSIKGKRTTVSQNGCGTSSRANAMPLVSSTNTVPATRTETGVGPVGTDFGYFAGGKASGPLRSTVDRVDYSSDTGTASAKGALPAVRYYMGSAGNQSYGWFTGGNSAGYPTNSLSTVYRLDYGNDSTSPTPKGNLSIIRAMHAGTGNESYGYFAAGDATTHSSNPVYSTIDRIDYANDTATSTPKGLLNEAKTMLGAAGNQSYGYFAGGSYTLSSIDRIDYSNDSVTASPKGNLGAGVRLVGGTSNPSYAYFGGGFGPSNSTTNIQRLDFANDTGAPLHTTLGTAGTYQNSSTGSASFGYWGGADGSSGNYGTIIQRLDYSNDTGVAGTRGNLTSDASFGTAGVSARDYALPTTGPGPVTVDKGADGYQVTTNGPLGPAYGYTVGGLSYSLYQRVDYSNDTATATNQAHTSNPSGLSLSVGNNTHAFSWVSGGQGQFSSIVERYDYSADTTDSTAKGNFPAEKSYLAGAVGNGDYGYFMGGRNPGNSDTTDVLRVDYSNDTAAAAPKGPLTSARYHNDGGVGNQSYGYMGGDGLVSGSDIDRIDYSNDTATAVQKGNLSVNGGIKAATGNASYGYWGAGYPAQSTVSRLDYSNDSANTVNKGSLTVATFQLSAFGDTSFGYWSGGHPGPLSTVSRLDYSDDTTTSVSKGPLVQAVREHGGNSSRGNANAGAPLSNFIPRIRWVDSVAETSTTSRAFGYVAGGSDPTGTAKSDIGRIEYANDTATMTPKGTQQSSRSHVGSTGNNEFGYTGGGYNSPNGTGTSNIQRADYSNDTATSALKGTLGGVRFGLYATGNANFGYFAGGREPSAPGHTTIFRSTYANDTATTSTKGPLTTIRTHGIGSTGNQNFGYFGGAGVFTPYMTSIDRVDYSNDTPTASPKGNFNLARANFGAAGNANFGYFAAGRTTGNQARSDVDRVDYSNDTATATQKGPLSGHKYDISATGNSSFGYYFGGIPTTFLSVTDRIDYSNDTATAVTKGNLIGGRRSSTAYSAAANLAPLISAPVQPPFPYPEQLYNPASNKLHGYIGGGSSGPLSSVDRITFANDTATATPKGSLTATKYKRGGTGNVNYGYIGAGRPGPISIVDRIDYTNDTATATAKGPLSSARAGAAAVGNANYGYWFGGNTPGYTTRVDRLDFASDSSAAVTKGSLTAVRGYGSAVGNQNYGYHCGGTDGNPKSNIDRVDYSSDTPTMSPKGQLSFSASSDMADFSNSNYGWLAGRSPGPARSIIDRVDFSNDTATASARGPLTESRARATGTGDSNYGYACGGMPEPGRVSKVERVDYSNDTATASPKGNLTSVRADAGGVSAGDNGL